MPPATCPGPAELPPRARRIPPVVIGMVRQNGTTSACAENTSPMPHSRQPSRNYLRVRGEYSISDAELLEQLELPPRARRIRGPPGAIRPAYGTTSACAENTNFFAPPNAFRQNYLRVRGEYTGAMTRMRLSKELPPRARRIQQNGDALKQIEGTTSACAENTVAAPTGTPPSGNYLRVRGEYQQRRSMGHPQMGTTSACAENTLLHPCDAAGHRNYLRVRGEYPTSSV